jgi:hypothetical protein
MIWFEGKWRTGPCQLAGKRAVSVLDSFVMVVMVVMMVLGRGKRRCGNHHNEQGGEQEFSHACIVALVELRLHTTFGEESNNPNQGSEHWTRHRPRISGETQTSVD